MKPFTFCATDKPFKVRINPKQGMVVTGYTKGRGFEYFFRFTRPVSVKEGDVFKAAPGRGLILNGQLVERNIVKPKGKTPVKVSWVAKRLRVAIFIERDRLWNRKTKKFTKKFGKPYWTACDVRSYHVGCGDDPVTALKRLLEQCAATNLIAEEDRRKGRKVIRGRCLLSKNEAREMERKARKTGLILDGVEVPEFRKLV